MSSIVVDSTAVDATNTALTLTSGAYTVKEINAPTPDVDPRFVTQNQADGDRLEGLRYLNREITLTINVTATTAAGLESAMNALTMKWAKLNREGGTITFTAPSGTVKTVYVLTAPQITPSIDIAYADSDYRLVTASVICEPFARGAETSYSSHAETTLPHVVFTEVDVPGDVPALGRLELTDAQGVDQAWAVWGLQSRYYSSDADAALFYEAEGRTALGTAAITTVTGASGGGSNNAVTQGTLTTSYAGILSTQAVGGGSHLEHIGNFRVFARLFRPTTNTGAVTVALEWAEGDFRRFTRNAAVAYAADEREGAFTIADLGRVYLSKALTGPQRWEGRIVAKSTVLGDDVSVDCLWLVPISEGWGELSAGTQTPPSASTISARDEFEQTAGSLAGKTLPVGGTWTGAGDADDFTIDTANDRAVRSAVSDGSASLAQGRIMTAGSVSISNVAVQASLVGLTAGTVSEKWGVVARYVDANNFVAAVRGPLSFSVIGRFASTEVTLAADTTLDFPGTPSTIQLIVGGSRFVAILDDGDHQVTLSGSHAQLASGGAAASGSVGFLDQKTDAAAQTRSYDNFLAYPYSTDAAVFASQSAQVRWDGTIREDSTGTFYVPVSKYEGDRLTVPPEGPESRSVRVIAKASRNHPDTGTDDAIDDFTARLHVTARYLAFP